MKKTKEMKGITLVALVITVIILLILATISIQTLTNTGLFGKAKEATKKYSEAEEKEKIQMELYYAQINKSTNGTSTNQIGEQLYDKNVENGSKWHIIVINDSKKIYGTGWTYIPRGSTISDTKTNETWLINNSSQEIIKLEDGTFIESKTVVLTTGTYMTSNVLRGHTSTVSGPEDQRTVNTLSESLREAGIKTFRLKTGTPPRIKMDTIDFSKTEPQPGTNQFLRFSETTKQEDVLPFEKQEICHLIYTQPETHEIIHTHLHDSAMYSGLVKGVGPRYCPSIEDKLVRFADKERHQLFLEPESKELDTIYIQGFSTSMPIDVQEKMVHSLPGLENCVIEKYAYAIEYDAIDPLQMKPNMENKIVENLFTAGQVNGTSGYEEAAGQGLMAGANAALKVDGKEPFVLRRDEAYIGVMLDDLCTKGTKEPYRLLTSRAEYRLLLRHDNADQRLLEKGYEIGLVSQERYDAFKEKMDDIEVAREELSNAHIKPNSEVNEYLDSLGFDPLAHGCSALDLIKRPKITVKGLAKYTGLDYETQINEQIEIQTKYAGYIAKAKRDAKHLQQMEKMKLPTNLDYENMDNLSLEARQKLTAIKPLTLGQASRISGINPSDIAILAMRVK